MRKKLFWLSALFLLVAASAFGQRSLEIKDVSSELNVFSGKDTEAGIVFSCPVNISLAFESSHDKMVDVYNKEQKGEEMFYYLRFNTGKKYRGRKLTILAPNYTSLTIVADLNPKELKQYQLLDPDVEFVYGCYYEYRKRGTDFFQKAMYSEAKEQYNIAKECSDCPADANLDELIANIDSISVYQNQAEEAFVLLDYLKAKDLYGKILVLNPADSNAAERRFNCDRLYGTDCKKLFDYAEVYKGDGEYEKALELYQKVVDLDCPNALVASEQAKRIRVLMQSRKQHARVYAYEYSKGAPIGLTTGTYKNRKVGGYFSLSLHPDVFYLIRDDYDKAKKSELNLSFGFTINPVRKYPVWIFFGPGYTGVGRYENSDGSSYIPGTYDEEAKSDDGSSLKNGNDTEEPKLKIYSAISPEIGLLGKIGPLVLRYTFQYRFALSKDNEDKIDSSRHVFGIGFCF